MRGRCAPGAKPQCVRLVHQVPYYFCRLGGGAAVQLVVRAIVGSGQSTARIQEAHALIGDVVWDLVERLLGID